MELFLVFLFLFGLLLLFVLLGGEKQFKSEHLDCNQCGQSCSLKETAHNFELHDE